MSYVTALPAARRVISPYSCSHKSSNKRGSKCSPNVDSLGLPAAAERSQTNDHSSSGCLAFCGRFHLFLQLRCHADTLPQLTGGLCDAGPTTQLVGPGLTIPICSGCDIRAKGDLRARKRPALLSSPLLCGMRAPVLGMWVDSHHPLYCSNSLADCC